MISIYRQGFACVIANWRYYIGIAIVFEVLTALFLSQTASGGATFAAYAIFAYAIHRYLLLQVNPLLWGRASSSRPETIGRFMWVSFLLMILPIGSAVWFALSFAKVPDVVPNDVAFVGILVVIFFVTNWIGLSIFGTALPASAIGDPFGIGITLRRARHTFLRVFGGLLAGPGLFGLLTLVGGGYLLGQTGLPSDFRDASGGFSGIGLVIGCMLRILGFINTTLAIVVLCDAYKRVQPIDAAMPDAAPAPIRP